ncbi:MAG: hypothetical protein D6748_06200 [Calditrichaeota bacterium]|nr:MAG: hypothetical protein D6748_06200 [Calditrichota bacterium]
MTTNKEKAKEMQAGLTEKAREIWLAGLGVFSTIEEEGEKLFNKFLEKGKELEGKGEEFEKKAKETVSSLSSYFSTKSEEISKEVTEKLSQNIPQMIEENVQKVVEKLGLTSKTEVQELSDKVDRLTKMVEDLSKKMSSSEKPQKTGA